MISSNLILAAKGIRSVPLIVVIVCAAIAGIAFFLGFKKGFRRISWGCLTCVVATAGFAFANGMLIKKKIVLNVDLEGVLDARAITTFCIAIACIALVLVIYGLCTWLLRPSYKIINKNPIVGEKCGIKVENDDDKHAPQYVRWRNAGAPTVFGRVLGGTICAINCLGVMAMILSVIVIVINATALNETILASAMSVKAARIFLEYSLKYAVDFIIVSCIVLMAFRGYQNGLVGSIRFLVVSFGGMILGALAFTLPFMGGDALFFTPRLVERCMTLLGGVPEQFRRIAAQLLTGVLFFILFMALLAVMNFALTKLNYIVIRLKPMRTFDGVLACFLYLLLGVLICVGIWCVLYALEYCGLAEISKAFSEDSSLAGSLMKLSEKLIKPTLEKFLVK